MPAQFPQRIRQRVKRFFSFGKYHKTYETGGGGSVVCTTSSISSGTPNATDATITWTTNLPTYSKVYWGLTTAYGGVSSPIVDSTLTTSHSIQITGLVTATTYHYKVESGGPGIGTDVSADGSFITA